MLSPCGYSMLQLYPYIKSLWHTQRTILTNFLGQYWSPALQCFCSGLERDHELGTYSDNTADILLTIYQIYPDISWIISDDIYIWCILYIYCYCPTPAFIPRPLSRSSVPLDRPCPAWSRWSRPCPAAWWRKCRRRSARKWGRWRRPWHLRWDGVSRHGIHMDLVVDGCNRMVTIFPFFKIHVFDWCNKSSTYGWLFIAHTNSSPPPWISSAVNASSRR